MAITHIRPQHLVLEIGSGHNPKTRSDVLCDKSLADNTERGGVLTIDRPLVVADGEFLPFRDGAFDYVICSHVLEHAIDAQRFLTEIQRVGRAGYIETPSEIAEWLYGWEYHRWLVNRVGDTLVLRPKTQKGPFGKLFHILAAQDPDFARLHIRYHHLFLVQLEWRGRIRYELRDADNAPFDLGKEATVAELLERREVLPLSRRLTSVVWNRVPSVWRLRIKRALARGKAPRRPRPNLRELLVCPRCHGELEWEEKAIYCPHDAIRFPLEKGIPIMLLPESRGEL